MSTRCARGRGWATSWVWAVGGLTGCPDQALEWEALPDHASDDQPRIDAVPDAMDVTDAGVDRADAHEDVRASDADVGCPSGQSRCRYDGQCHDLQNDFRNCGLCDRRCGDASRCEQGVCICNRGGFELCGECLPVFPLCDGIWSCRAGGRRCNAASLVPVDAPTIEGCCVPGNACPERQFCDRNCQCVIPLDPPRMPAVWMPS